jgi:Flp pilus assembly protein TadD
MAEVIARIATAVIALVLVAGFAIELHAHDELASAAKVAVQAHPARITVDKQLDAMKSIEKLRPGSDPFLAAAALDFRVRRFAEAARQARRATEREPKNFSAWVTLAVARAQVGDTAGARAAYAKAHVLNPFYPIPR